MHLHDDELELFARHVSLPEVGMHGQAHLLETTAFVGPDVPGRDALMIGLQRSGVELLASADKAQWRIESGLGPAKTVDISPRQVDVGAFDLHLAGRLESSAALYIKERWLGALLASEIVLAMLGKRPTAFTLELDFPVYRVRSH
jgi:hypothetical protein